MSAKRITRVELTEKGSVVEKLPNGQKRRKRGATHWNRLEAMSEKEIVDAAKKDRDSPLLTMRQLKAAYRVPEKINVQAVRKRLHMSQQVFAHKYGFAVDAIQDWEQGRRKPNRSAHVLLQIIAREPEAVDRALRA